jgi:hypothetical protein
MGLGQREDKRKGRGKRGWGRDMVMLSKLQLD